MAMRGLLRIDLRLMWPGAGVARCLWRIAKVHGCLPWLLRCLTVEIRHAVGIGRSTLSLVVVPSEIVRMSILSSSRLWHVRNDLHPTGHNTSGATAPRCIRRGSGTAKTFSQLLNQRLTNVIGSNVNGIGNTKNNQ